MLSLGEQQWTLAAGTDTISIGRASNADIRLQADDQISRIHARLNRDGDSWTLHDESRNGTGLNGRRITAPTPLTTGDRIHIGRSVLTFTESATPSPADAPAQASAPEAPYAAPTPVPQNEPTPVTPPAPNQLPQPDQPPAASPFAQPDQPAAADPPAQPDQPPALTPSAQPDQAPAASPFAQPDQAPAASPFAQQEQVPGGSPFAQGEQVRDDGPFAQADQPAAASSFAEHAPGDSPFAVGEQEPAGGPLVRDEQSPGDPYGAEAGRGYGAAGVVPGFEVGDGGTWAAYPSADNPERVRSPSEISAQIDQSEHNWNASAGWPDPTAAAVDQRAGGDRRAVGRDRRAAGGDRRAANADRRPAEAGQQRSGAGDRLPGADQSSGAERSTADDAVGAVRLSRVLIAAGAVIVLGIVVNLVVTFLADGPGGVLRWLVPPGIALVVAMVLALADAALPKDHRPGRLNVPVLVAVAVVLVGVGVGGFALTAGAEYAGGYLTGNETGEDRLIKPVTKPGTGVTMTVENVTYTSHFTRVEVKLINTAKEAITVPIDGTTFTAADGTALRADPGRSAWPSRIAAGGTEHGTLTFKGHLPDSATAAVLTFKSGSTSFAISKIALSN